MPYVFYDTETTGTETAFDQILQFSAIRTDDSFNELERLDVRCRLLPHVVPSPGALRVTRVTPAMLTDPALPSHYEAIRQIRAKLLEWSPATFIGFNSLDFDENLLRQALFQTLHSAYLTNTNGNARSDVMRVAHAVSIYASDSIVVPTNDQGRQTFRLDRLAPANGYRHDKAHEAMADVEATIYMARLARDRALEIWQAMNRASTKDGVKEYVAAQSMFSLTERYFGRTFSWLVTPCGQNSNDDGQLAVFDLHYDPENFRSLSAEELVSVLDARPKVIRSLRANRQPIMMSADMAPKTVRALTVGDGELCRRAAIIQSDQDFRARVGRAQAMRFADEEPSPHIEKRLNDGFPGSTDERLMEKFHNVNWPDRLALAERIEDSRVKEFAYRLIYFERPDVLPDARVAEFNAWRSERMLSEDEGVPWMTIGKALREADDLLKTTTGDEAALLSDVKEFLYELAHQF